MDAEIRAAERSGDRRAWRLAMIRAGRRVEPEVGDIVRRRPIDWTPCYLQPGETAEVVAIAKPTGTPPKPHVYCDVSDDWSIMASTLDVVEPHE